MEFLIQLVAPLFAAHIETTGNSCGLYAYALVQTDEGGQANISDSTVTSFASNNTIDVIIQTSLLIKQRLQSTRQVIQCNGTLAMWPFPPPKT